MDLQTYLDKAVGEMRAESFALSDQLTLGKIISRCQVIAMNDREEEPTVRFDFEFLVPERLDSWRGSYDELALGFGDGDGPKLSEFIRMLQGALGKTFYGYKGGDFVMSPTTPVWVANYGNSGNTAVIEVVDNSYEVILMTAYRNY